MRRRCHTEELTSHRTLSCSIIGWVRGELAGGMQAGEIKRHPEVETLLVTRDKPTKVTKKVLTWLT
jgi:hypothetical protein